MTAAPAAAASRPTRTRWTCTSPRARIICCVKIGNVSGGWEFAARIPGFDGAKYVQSKEPSPEDKQRAYALATKHDGSWLHAGDPKKGEKVFRDPTGPLAGICATCHTVRGQGGQVGPDLTADRRRITSAPISSPRSSSLPRPSRSASSR